MRGSSSLGHPALNWITHFERMHLLPTFQRRNEMKTFLAVAIYTIALIFAHIVELRHYAKQCQETVEWAIQDTSDTLHTYCEEQMEKKGCK